MFLPSNDLLIRAACVAGLALLLTACGDAGEERDATTAPAADATAPSPEAAAPATGVDSGMDAREALIAALEGQPAEAQARYRFRHPQQTLEFFGIEPGMTVVEVLPSGGWYSKILIPYLGREGTLIGADYAMAMWPLFGRSAEAVAEKASWPEDWVTEAGEWRGDDGAGLAAFQLGALPDSLTGTADAVLFIRALHNIARFESEGGFLTAAIDDAWQALRPGGVVGVVQHMAPEAASDAWASGNNGYLKKSAVIAAFEAAGFELEGDSEVNVNPADRPTESDFVWRLPPTLGTSRGDEEAAAAFREIGESTRMTLKFRKPA